MPKTAVDEDHGAVLRKDEIGCAREVASMKAKPETRSMRRPSDDEFRRSVLSSHGAHVNAALGRCERVDHASYQQTALQHGRAVTLLPRYAGRHCRRAIAVHLETLPPA
jgi:hypothetical protein